MGGLPWQLRALRNLDQQGTQLFLRADLQLAASSLMSLERFALGGINSVRGFRQNELVRDEGYALALELRYPLLGEASSFKGHHLSLVPFFDIGEAWNLGGQSTIVNDRFQTLMFTGIGLQWRWHQFDADFYWAQAISHRPPNGNVDADIQDQGIHFRLHTRIL